MARRPVVTCVVVWKGWLPRAASGWAVVTNTRLRIYDGKRRLLGEAPVDKVWYRETWYFWGGVVLHVDGQRFMLSPGGAAAVPESFGDDVPAVSGAAEYLTGFLIALGKAGAHEGKRPRGRTAR